ncbi:MAG TPA: hypothetical protein VF647_26340 [Longimicrobium sp.]
MKSRQYLSSVRHARRLAPLVVFAALAACADDQTTGSAPFARPGAPRLVTAPFSCGLSYTSTNTFYDADLATYGIPEITTTHDNCETWTGSDYRLFVQETSSSVTDPEVANDVTTSWYQYGVTRGFNSAGVEIADATQVAADAFALGLASPEEKQASYNEPYYAVYSGGSRAARGCATISSSRTACRARRAPAWPPRATAIRTRTRWGTRSTASTARRSARSWPRATRSAATGRDIAASAAFAVKRRRSSPWIPPPS